MSRAGGKSKFAANFEQNLMSLTRRFGFKPSKVEVNTRFGVATIYFNNQKGEATRLVSKLAPAMAQMGIPASAIKAREVHYPADADLGDDQPMDLSIVTIDFNVLDKHNPKAFSRAGEAEAFAIGADSRESNPQNDERLMELATKVGKEHTVNLFARWAEGKATMGVSRVIPTSKESSGGGTWTTKSQRYGAKKATVSFYNKGGLIGSVYQDPDNPSMFKAFEEPAGREIASGSEALCKSAVEQLAN
jgi:hypothetical protein